MGSELLPVEVDDVPFLGQLFKASEEWKQFCAGMTAAMSNPIWEETLDGLQRDFMLNSIRRQQGIEDPRKPGELYATKAV